MRELKKKVYRFDSQEVLPESTADEGCNTEEEDTCRQKRLMEKTHAYKKPLSDIIPRPRSVAGVKPPLEPDSNYKEYYEVLKPIRPSGMRLTTEMSASTAVLPTNHSPIEIVREKGLGTPSIALAKKV